MHSFRLLPGYLVVSISLCLTGWAQAPANSEALLEGSVVNKVTGAAVKHAHVMYIKVPSDNSSPISTDTDADGHFSMSLPAGSYRLWVERPGFARQAYGSRTPEGVGTVLTLSPGQRVRDVNLRMAPLGAISGRVLDEEGEPLQGVGIQVLRFSYATGRRQLIPILGTSTNDRGEYRAYGLASGRYYLLATLRGAPMSHPEETAALVPEVQDPFAAVYYPGVLDFPSASEIPLPEGGEHSDADFHLQRVPAVTVRGRLFSPVEDFTGSQVQVVLAHSEGNSASFINRATATVDRASGRFEFRGISPGPYLLAASQLYGGHAYAGRLALVVNATTAHTSNLTLTAAFDITGTVEVEGGSSAKLSNTIVRLVPSEGLAMGAQLPSSKIGPGGSIRLAGVTPGNWQFTLNSLPEDLWIKTATFDTQDVLSGELNVSSGTHGQLHILLAGNGGQVSGTVTEDEKPGHATVVLVPTAADLQGYAQMYRSTTTGDQGTFLFKGVRPGSYKLFAFEDVEAFSWLDPEFLKPVESMGEPITVGEGEKVTRKLSAVPPDALLPGR